MKRLIILSICCLSLQSIYAQEASPEEIFRQFKQQQIASFRDFRKEVNNKYTEFMRGKWDWFNSESSIEDIENKVKPMPAPPAPEKNELKELKKAFLEHGKIVNIYKKKKEQPTPVSPIQEVNQPDHFFQFNAYGTQMEVRMGLDTSEKYKLKGATENDVADMWMYLSDKSFNNLIHDCLELRMKHSLCDWAYLQTLKELSQKYYGENSNEAIVLQTFLFNQSGYKTRIGRSRSNRLYMMIASPNTIYGKAYFKIKDEVFYPLDYQETGLYVFAHEYPGEEEMSLQIDKEQLFDVAASDTHCITSKAADSLSIEVKFNSNLMNFYHSYPQSHINNDEMTKWSIYASTPLSESVKKQLYPPLRNKIKGKTEVEAANILIGFVQTAFEYQLDEVVWGQDRPFFPEETLFYPFSDCEDRAALFSNLIRDLLGLNTVLLYYPGHLAMAVKFNQKIEGKTLLIDGSEYTYCEPTCSSYAPVGWCPSQLSSIKPVIIKY